MKYQKLRITGLLFVAPWLVGFVIFFLSPLAQAIAFSMNKVTITAAGLKMDYVGAGNYADIFIRDAYYVDRLLRARGYSGRSFSCPLSRFRVR